MNELRVAIVGAGYMGQVHGRALQKQRGVRICGVCDAVREKGEGLAGALGLEAGAVYTNVERMLKTSEPDAVYICTPPFVREVAFCAAAERGVHIFLEKPVAVMVQAGERMARAARAAGIVTHVGYHMRHGVAVQRLARMIANGQAGRPVLFDGRYECNALHGAWWLDKRKSGGQVLEQAIHVYDLGLYLFGGVRRVSGYAGNICHQDVPGYSVEDVSAAALQFANGAVGTIAATNCAVPMEWNNPFTVVCEKVTARFVTANEAEFVYTGGKEVRREEVKGEVDVYEAETKEFIKRVRGEKGIGADIEEGLAGLRIVSGVLESAKGEGKAVRVDGK